MERPYVPRPQLPRLYIETPRMEQVPGVSLQDSFNRNKSISAWQRQLDSQQHKKKYMADYNDPDQVNSIADLIRSPIKSLIEGRGWGTISKFGRDLVDYGKLQLSPILNADPKAYGLNVWNNLMETLDLVDNVWKAYTITKEAEGLQRRLETNPNANHNQWTRNRAAGSFGAGLEGIKQAMLGKNFDFEGHGLGKNLMREVATPTNILLTALTFGTAGVARAGATQAGKQIGGRALGYIGKNAAKGSIDDIIEMGLKAGKFKVQDAVLLQTARNAGDDIIHAGVMKSLSNINKLKRGADIVDSLGPTIAWKSTVLPAWKLGKYGWESGSAAMTYMRKALDDAALSNLKSGSKLTISSFNKAGGAEAVEETAKTFTEILPELGESMTLEGALAYNRKLAKEEVDALKRLERLAYSKVDQAKIVQEMSKQGGKLDATMAEALITADKNQSLIRHLDLFVRESSQGTIKNWEEYRDFVTNLYNKSGTDRSIAKLKKMVDRLSNQTLQTNTFNKVIDTFKGTVQSVSSLSEAIDPEKLEGPLDYYVRGAKTSITENIADIRRSEGILANLFYGRQAGIGNIPLDDPRVAPWKTVLENDPVFQSYYKMDLTSRYLKEQAVKFDMTPREYKRALIRERLYILVDKHEGLARNRIKNAEDSIRNVLRNRARIFPKEGMFEQFKKMLGPRYRHMLDDIEVPKEVAPEVDADLFIEAYGRNYAQHLDLIKKRVKDIREWLDEEVLYDGAADIATIKRKDMTVIPEVFEDYLQNMVDDIKSLEIDIDLKINEILDKEISLDTMMDINDGVAEQLAKLETDLVDRFGTFLEYFDGTLPSMKEDAVKRLFRDILPSGKIGSKFKEDFLTHPAIDIGDDLEDLLRKEFVDNPESDVINTVDKFLADITGETELDVIERHAAQLQDKLNKLSYPVTVDGISLNKQQLEDYLMKAPISPVQSKQLDDFVSSIDGVEYESIVSEILNIQEYFRALPDTTWGEDFGPSQSLTARLEELIKRRDAIDAKRSKAYSEGLEKLRESRGTLSNTDILDTAMGIRIDGERLIGKEYVVDLENASELNINFRLLEESRAIHADTSKEIYQQILDNKEALETITGRVKALRDAGKPTGNSMVEAMKELFVTITNYKTDLTRLRRRYLEVVNITDEYVAEANKIRKFIDHLDNMLGNSDLTNKTVMRALGEEYKQYKFMVSHMYRWFQIYDQPEVHKIVDAVANNSDDVSFIQPIKGIGAFGNKDIFDLHLYMSQDRPDLMNKVFERDSAYALKNAYDRMGHDAFKTMVDNSIGIKGDALKVMDTLDAMGTFKVLIDNLLDSGLDRDVRIKFFDALQSYHDKLDGQFYSKFTMEGTEREQLRNIRKVIDQVDNLMAQESKHSLKLTGATETVFDMHKKGLIQDNDIDLFQKVFPNPELSAHSPCADAMASVVIRKHLLPENIDNKLGKTLGVDIEADSVQPYMANLHTLGVYDDSAKEFDLIIRKFDRPNVLENDDLLAKLYSPDKKRVGDMDMRTAYNKIHYEGDVDTFFDWYEIPTEYRNKFNVQVVESNEEVAEAFKTIKEKRHPGRGELKIDIFNGTDYDADLLNNLTGERLVDKTRLQDSLIDLRNKYGGRRLRTSERQKLEEIIEKYIGERSVAYNGRWFGMEELPEGLQGQFGNRKGYGDLIPAFDDDFTVSLSRVEEVLRNNERGTYDPKIELMKHADPESMMDLTRFRQSISESKRTIKQNNMWAGKHTIDTDKIEYLFPEGFFNGIPKEMRSDKNVIAAITAHSEHMGVHFPLFMVKKKQVHGDIYRWFNVNPGDELQEIVVDRLSKLGVAMSRTADKVVNISRIVKPKLVNRMLDEFIATQMKISDHAYVDILNKFGKSSENVPQLFAQGVHKMNVISTLRDTNPQAVDELVHKIRIELEDYIYGADGNIVGTKGFFNIYMDPRPVMMHPEVTPIDNYFEFRLNDYSQKIYDYIQERLDFNARTLENFTKTLDDLEYTSPLRRMTPVYESMLEGNIHIQRAADDYVARNMKDGMNEEALKRKFFSLARYYYDASMGMRRWYQLEKVLNLEADDFLSYVYHMGKGKVVIDVRDLDSASMIKRRNDIKPEDIINASLSGAYDKLMSNREYFESQGLLINRRGNKVAFEVRKDAINKFKDRPLVKFNEDLQLDEADFSKIKDVVDIRTASGLDFNEEDWLRIKRGLKQLETSRRKIINLAPSGALTSLEKLDDIAMHHALEKIGKFSDEAMDLEDMVGNNLFDGNPFNHTFLGSIDSVRDALDFVSYNPNKNIYNASQTLHQILDTKTQYLNAVISDEFKLENIAADMADEDIANFFRDNRAYVLAFLSTNKRGGDIKLKKFIVRNADDIKRAKEFKAIVLDEHTYTTAVATINNNKLPKPLRKLNEVILTPWKIAVMGYNFWTVFRNLFDSGMKNVVTAKGDTAIFNYMHKTFVDYWNYHQVGKKAIRVMREKNISIEAATDLVFKEGGLKIDRETYDLITFYKQNAPSSGMIKALQKHYGKALDKSYQEMSGRELGISKSKYSKFVRTLDDSEALGWVKHNFPKNITYQENLLRARKNFQVHKKAYAMLDGYKGKTLTVRKVVDAIRNRNAMAYWNPEDIAYFNKSLKQVENMRFNESIMNKVMNNPLVDNSLTLHGAVEEILRIGLYRYLKDHGSSIAEATELIKRTHFDYNHKSMGEMWLEMIVPFSTFRKNSLIYWMEQLDNSPQLVKYVGKYKKAQAEHSEVDLDDMLMQRAYMYHLKAGNLIDNDAGKAYKLMPSVIDAINTMTNPAEYLINGTHPLADTVKNVFTMEPYANETMEDFNYRKRRLLASLIPLAGPTIFRATKLERGEKYDDYFSKDGEENYLERVAYNLALGGFVSDTWTPKTDPSLSWKKWDTGPIKKTYKLTNGGKFTRPEDLNYRGSDIYRETLYRMRGNRVYFTRYARRPKAWGRIMTKKNKLKRKYYAMPTNKYTLEMKMNLMYHRVLNGGW